MKSKNNILYIFHVSSIGGGSFCLLNMIKSLNTDLFNPIILLKNEGPLSIELTKLGATVVFDDWVSTVPYNKSILSLQSLKQYLRVILSMRRIWHRIKFLSPDIVHLNTMMMYPYSLLGHSFGAKVITHVREHWPENEHRLQLLIARRIIRKYSSCVIAINSVSNAIISNSRKNEIIYDWIDFSNRSNHYDFRTLFGSDYKSLKIFLFLGGIHNIKGSLEIFDVFSHDVDNENARLLVIGYENINKKKKIGIKRALLHKFNCYSYEEKALIIANNDDRIVFAPATYHVKSLIEQSYCSLSYFTIPHANMALSESVWLGKPVIAADTPEAREYSWNGKFALLFKMNSKNEFREKLMYTLNNKNLVETTPEAGLNHIHKMFDPKINSSKLHNVYLELIK